MHLNDGELRAHLDGQLGEAERQHLAGCPDCQTRLAPLTAQMNLVGGQLARLDPHPGDPGLDPRRALNRYKSRRAVPEGASRKDDSVINRLFSGRLRAAWGLAAALILVTVSLTFAPVRAWAGEFLGLFRVQQVAVLPLDFDTTRLSDLNGDSTLARQMGRLFADSVTWTQEPGKPRDVADAQAASREAGFAVRLASDSATAPKLSVSDGAEFEIVVDRDRAQALLDELGYADIRLPESLDGAKIRVEIPAGVSAAYGDCPVPDEFAEDDSPAHPADRDELKTCLILAQIPSPTVSTPPDLDVAQLAELGLQVMGMSPEEARHFSQTVDWTSTLVVPIPRNGSAYEQVAVDGVTGNLITRSDDDGIPTRYTLLWVKDGIVYAIAGFGQDTTRAIEMANSLK